jgi:ATP-dependent helicase HrpA
MTDGILLAEAERDRNFLQYDTIIIDEAHERSLNIDFLLGYLRKLIRDRRDLKVIISSATIDAGSFSSCFNDAPVIEVSGRLFPIEVLYRNPENEEGGEVSGYVENAVTAATDLLDCYGPGDMLVFMPTERDIRETCDKLGGALARRDIQILPLFSRLTRADQEAIFNPSGKIRLIVCTNIAETSVTVPGISYVVDTGLARVSRYAPRLRTNRLPIEPISRASADQRKGRCGRVRDGVCIRLYSEEDYNSREEFTLPEIKRSNLAGVILTMIARNLGAIEDFPFIAPPSKQAVSEGYAQLKELGAIDNGKKLTRMGAEMAQLPFDPHISRMLVAARKENALREVKIIAAALSIVDPRERPLEKQAEADAAHIKFVDKGSDFLTYVNLWDAYRNEWDTLKTQGALRRFCKGYFLSFTRMREWHDVYWQLDETLSRMKGYGQNPAPASYDAVHRSLLTGLLANCAYLDKNGKYKATGGKEVLIFPGSALAKKKCDWLVCHEIVETSRVFARTVAAVKPEWLEELAADFCKRTFENPVFDAESGCVRAVERVTLFGLPLAVRQNALYGRAEPEAATEIFIRDGLVEENLVCRHKFYEHNKQLKRKILSYEAKLRSRGYYRGDGAVFDFYKKRLNIAASIHDLNRAIRAAGNDKFLYMSEEDVVEESIPEAARAYPDHVNIGNRNFALKYAFNPGDEDDGVTLALPQKVLPFIAKETIGWLLPALWPAQIKSLLQQLPRGRRKVFLPLGEAAKKLADNITAPPATHESFAVELSSVIKKIYGVDIEPAMLDSDKADPHLDLKIEVRDEKNGVIAKGRSGDIFKRMNDTAVADGTDADTSVKGVIGVTGASINTAAGSPWDGAFASYRKAGLVTWPEEDLNKPFDIGSNKDGFAVRGYPALVPGDGDGVNGVDLVLFPSKIKSDVAHRHGVRTLLEITLMKDLAWTERDISLSKGVKVMCAPFASGDEFAARLYDMVCESALDFGDAPRSKEAFERLIISVKESLRGTGFRVTSVFEESLRIFTDNTARLTSAKKKFPADIHKELTGGLNGFFTDILDGQTTLEIFFQYPRYLKVFAAVIEKASFEPFKYRQKRAELNIYVSIYGDLRKKSAKPENSHIHKRLLRELALMIREFEINLFAQHIKTLYPVSGQRLDRKIGEIKKLL